MLKTILYLIYLMLSFRSRMSDNLVLIHNHSNNIEILPS